jgi:hypothetical protein
MAEDIIKREYSGKDANPAVMYAKLSADVAQAVGILATAQGELKVHDDRSETSATAGGQKYIFVSDEEGSNLLNSILKQLKITNMHLSIMTDNTISTGDAEV